MIIPSIIIGGVAAGASAYAGGKANKRSVRAAKELQARQFGHNITMRRTKIQTLANDLERAGFNRIIASGVGGAPTGAAGGGGGFPNLKNIAAEGIGAGANAMQATMALRERAATIGQIQQSTKTSKEQGQLYNAQKTGVMADNARRILVGDSIRSARSAAQNIWNKFIPKDMLDQAGELMTTPDLTTARDLNIHPGKPPKNPKPYPYGKNRGQHGSGSSGGTER